MVEIASTAHARAVQAPRAPSALPVVLLALLAALLGGCVVRMEEAEPGEPVELVQPGEVCAGNGCDDCNPCTVDAPTREGGCAHVGRTAPPGVLNDCFPVAGGEAITAGQCCAGACVPNGSTCE